MWNMWRCSATFTKSLAAQTSREQNQTAVSGYPTLASSLMQHASNRPPRNRKIQRRCANCRKTWKQLKTLKSEELQCKGRASNSLCNSPANLSDRDVQRHLFVMPHGALNIVAFISRRNACSSRAESPLEEALKHFPWLETQSGKCNVLSFQKSLAEHSCGAVTPHRRLWRNARRRVEETWMGSRWIKETSWRWFGNKASTSFYVYSTSLPGRSALYMFHQCSC